VVTKRRVRRHGSPQHPRNVKCDGPEEFAEIFTSQTSKCFFDRFIFGLGNGFEWRPVKVPKICLGFPPEEIEMGPEVDLELFDQRSLEWARARSDRGRLREHARRIALVSTVVSEELLSMASLEAALRFMEWQEEIRSGYKASVARNDDAQLTAAFLAAMEERRNYSYEWVKLLDLARRRRWYEKYGAPARQRVLLSLAGQSVVEVRQIKPEDGGKESWWVWPAPKEEAA
jgi:hypothetical protein